MPRVTLPAHANKTAPREFALLTQLKPDAKGNIDEEALKAFQKQYGDTKAAFKDEITFEEFTALFAVPKTTAEDGQGNTIGMAARDSSAHFTPYRFNRRDVGGGLVGCHSYEGPGLHDVIRTVQGDYDVRIQIAHTSICHSDVHAAKNDWQMTTYPIVPGHEIVGIVTEVGPKVTKFAVGDRAGVGCLVNSCNKCKYCKQDEEQYCKNGFTFTYNAIDPIDGKNTYGGYATSIVTLERFVLHIPDSLPLEGAAPLLCAGITVYSPLRHYGLDKPGMAVGVVGLGGLGAHAVKILKAFGCKVTVISTSASKEQEAREVLGADSFVISKDPDAMKAISQTLDGIIDTVSAQHELAPLLDLLQTNGKLVLVGAPPQPPMLPAMLVLMRRLTVAGSMIGGLKETQEMLDFCGEHGIVLPYETISADYIDQAYERVHKNDVRYRFVINIQGTLVQ